MLQIHGEGRRDGEKEKDDVLHAVWGVKVS